MSITRYLCTIPRTFRLLFSQSRECERLALNIVMVYPELGREWMDTIIKRAHYVASRSALYGPVDLMNRLYHKLFLLGFKAQLDDLRDVDNAIPEEWAR